MNGTLALLVALVSYGNDCLKQGTPHPEFDFSNSTLIYCNTIEFSDVGDSSSQKTVIANSPQQWFSFLKKTGCKKLKIFFYHSSNELQIRDFESAGFVGGGGQWIIEAEYDNYSDYWACNENVNSPNANDNRIWNIQFSIIKKKQATLNLDISIEKAKEDMSASLNKIMTFAFKTKSDYWAEIFRKADENLNSPQPVVEYYKDFIVEKQHSLQSRQLLFSASMASVFGGMGSWNDIMYSSSEEEKANAQLSSDLYDKINQAIIVALNND